MLSKFVGRSKDFADKKIIDSILQKASADREIRIDEIENPERVNILLNPADALEKIQRLRQMKREIVLSRGNNTEKIINPAQIAKEKIKDLYRKK
ncbi:MAG TPA: hypothetical protein PLF30_03755 [Candidatus Moranbacteria bacterium]|nr:hypothetical protein [Candidatus Moranbacteria bacterium]HPX94642.1 hypothetical protein [Candidatus Moranbacteria bacterium]HQB59849.1 hypothetical protein [Candidatus Moranbacteria bacterium]